MAPEVALAASARDWPDRLHRYLLDHGGGRVIGRVMGTEQAVSAEFDVLLIDDVCSFLTPRLVSMVKERGSDVVGVYASEDGSDAKRRLFECGISDVIEMGATPPEFLEKISSTVAHRPPKRISDEPDRGSLVSIGVTGATDGVGATELAASVAHALSKTSRAALFDLDTMWPSVAQRLDLPLHPNIRTVLDAVMHNQERVTDGLLRLGELRVVGGVADPARGDPLNRVEVVSMYEVVSGEFDVAISDLGPFERSIQGLGLVFRSFLVVGSGDPVGVARLLKTLESVVATSPQTQILAVVNKTSRKRFFEAEVRREVAKAYPDVPVLTIPFDQRVQQAAWEGQLVSSGHLFRATRRIARLISESVLT